MNILGCLDRASAGTYTFGGRDISKLGPDQLAELRREHFGFIFQRYQLLADLDAVENTAMPAIYAGVDGGTRTARAKGSADAAGPRRPAAQPAQVRCPAASSSASAWRAR